MGCLTLKVTPLQPATLAVEGVGGAAIAVDPEQAAAISVKPEEEARLAVKLVQGASLAVKPTQAAELTIGEVCSVTPGTIVVLAAADGPLRTRNGGYFLLNPATNPPEN
jgi:hypothetical protein